MAIKIDPFGYSKLRLYYQALDAGEGSNNARQMEAVINYFKENRHRLRLFGISWQRFLLHLELYIIDLDNPGTTEGKQLSNREIIDKIDEIKVKEGTTP